MVIQMEICDWTAVELAEQINKGQISTTEALEAVFSRIEEREGQLHSFLTLDKDGAFVRAEEIQKKINRGELSGPLAGVPAAYKDNLCVPGMPATCGSLMLKDFVPEYEATAVGSLRQEGVICLGKTNMDEFAMGQTTETSAFGPTANPRNTAYVPGGSSGGSGAAAAAGECFFSLGTDTGGSIRQPAAYCGLVGLKPTYGSVSRYGLIAYGSSLEQIGPMTRDVRDCETVFRVVRGRDERDATSRRTREEQQEEAGRSIKGKKIGIIRDFLDQGLSEENREAVKQAALLWEKQGAFVEECSFSHTRYLVPVYYTIASAEASSNLERYDGVNLGYSSDMAGKNLHQWYKENRSRGFGPEVKKRIMLGTFVLSEGYYEDYYLQSCKVRRLIKEEMEQLFTRYDVLLLPVTPGQPPKRGESRREPVQMYLQDIYTVSANLTGMPAISLPFGVGKKGLPIGVQLMADYHREDVLFDFGYVLERERKAGQEVEG